MGKPETTIGPLCRELNSCPMRLRQVTSVRMSQDFSERTGPRSGRRPPPEGAVVRPNGSWIRPWRKGQNGNPGGVHGEYYRVRKLCVDNSYEAVQRLLEIIRDKNADERVVYMAVAWLVERGLGKPRDHSGEQEGIMDLNKLTPEERLTLLKLMSRVLGVEEAE